MILGKVSGRITTGRISFEADARVRKMDYVSIKDPEGKWILACIDSVVRYTEKTMASARVIGYRDKRGFLKTPKVPFSQETPVFSAPKDFIRETLGIPEGGAYIGLLEGYDIKVNLDIKHMIRKHVAVLAKTGTGKSYLVGVLLEELAENKIPVVVIDPHGEYHTLKLQNRNKDETKYNERFGIESKSYRDQVNVLDIGNSPKSIKLSSKLDATEIIQMLPAGLSAGQKGILYSALRNLEGKEYTLQDVMEEVANSNSQSKWNVVSMMEFLLSTKLFSANPTLPKDIVKEGKVTILDLKDGKPEIQHIVVMKVIEDLFNARKHGKIPEFLLVIEEAHNFCPERGFGEVASSRIIRSVASEGRKFGFGLCMITQRPARIDKSVLSQANTQVILKVTNPNDLKAITDSVEGITPGLRDEIKDLPVGVAMVVGMTDHPLMTDIRIRRSQHGGESVTIDSHPPEEDKPLAFQPRVTEENVLSRYKGVSSPAMLNYPLWKVRSRFRNQNLDFYVDGITGEVVFERDNYISRSKGVRNLLQLPPSSRLIVFYLTRNRAATLEKLSGDLKIPMSTIQGSVKELMKMEYLGTDGYMFSNRLRLENIPPNPSTVQIQERPQPLSAKGTRLDFMVSQDFVRKVSELWELNVHSIEPVYYPYWVVEHKERKLLIDALTMRAEEDISESVKRLL